ncbi:TPM domain-containing protein [Anaerocellum danielii]|uniref:TPM domain-containing protein n=1 Tax=Anaerocellum danielii TaxID=1387557 RepID=A0ABZ0TZL6_9FIRM|nr:TPM domain-containing protein [Caldicellulosiruptor danielii]WPX08860.1 TPM domain-containing protein [Caldicellulosiruptor danielii]
MLNTLKARKNFYLAFIFSVLFLFIAFLPLYSLASIPQKPAENSYIFDYANLIDDSDEDQMRALAKKIEDSISAEIVVVTVETLGNYTIEEYALNLFRKWGIGNKEKDNGVLILVNKENLLANKKGKIRIEVGYGLEGAIPDGKAGRILDTYAIPAFENKEYSRGIKDTFFAVASEVAKEYNLNLDEIQGYSGMQTSDDSSTTVDDSELKFSDVIMIIIFVIIFVFVLSKSRRKGCWWYRGPWDGFGGGSSSSGGGFGGFGGGSSGGGGASR